MALVMTSAPALEPVTLAEAKAHLRVDGTTEDWLIQSLIITSRLHVEAAVGLALITQSWSYTLDRWPRSLRLSLPLRPVAAIAEVKIWRTDGSSEVVPSSSYFLDGFGQPARIVWTGSELAPEPSRAANGVEIAFTAGFGAAPTDVPSTIRHAILLLVAHWYEHREPIEIGSGVNPVPAMVSELLAPHRRRRL